MFRRLCCQTRLLSDDLFSIMMYIMYIIFIGSHKYFEKIFDVGIFPIVQIHSKALEFVLLWGSEVHALFARSVS